MDHLNNKERQLLSEDDLVHKLLKQERHLLEDLHDAQAAEARALERFRRVQSKLQRRKARVMRLENRLALARKELATYQANLNSQELQNGHVSTIIEAPASDLMATYNETPSPVSTDEPDLESSQERAEEVASPAPIDTTTASLDPAVAVPTPSAERPDAFEPEPFVTPVFVSASEPTVIEASPVPQPADVEETSVEQPIIKEPGASLLEQLAHEMSIPAAEAQPTVEDRSTINEESKPASVVEPEPSPAMETETQPATIAQEEAASSPILAEAMGLWKTPQPETQPAQSRPDDSSASITPDESITPPQPEPPAISPAQSLNEAREAWQEAEAGVQQARTKAHDLAASISILAQTGLSGSLMEELLRKQSEANKALINSQKSARGAYERLVEAEEAYQLAQQEKQSQTNGLASTSSDDGDATVQMHAIHLYKEW